MKWGAEIADKVGIDDMGTHICATTAINEVAFFGFGKDECEALLGLVGQLREALEMGLDLSDATHKDA